MIGTKITTKSGRKGAIVEPPFELPGRVLVDFGDGRWWVPEWAICQPGEEPIPQKTKGKSK
jgi:hypothetical protein